MLGHAAEDGSVERGEMSAHCLHWAVQPPGCRPRSHLHLYHHHRSPPASSALCASSLTTSTLFTRTDSILTDKQHHHRTRDPFTTYHDTRQRLPATTLCPWPRPTTAQSHRTEDEHKISTLLRLRRASLGWGAPARPSRPRWPTRMP
jgi:hypothetical protein